MIEGKQTRLRGAERSDLDYFVRWLNDPEVRAGLTLYLPISMAEEQRWFESMLDRPWEEHPLVIEAQEGEGWTPIGNCGFHQIDWRSRTADVGIFIGEKSYWNRGLGTDVMAVLLRHGFENLNLNRVGLRVYEDNPRAIRVYEKAGFVHEGRLRQAMYNNGRYVDILLMSVLRSEWAGDSEQEAL